MKRSLINLLFIPALFIQSCSKKEGSSTFDRAVDIRVFNQQSQNLFEMPAVLNENNVKVYYVVDGKEILQEKAFYISVRNGVKAMTLTVTNDPTIVYPAAIVKFGNLGSDTVKMRMEKLGDNYLCRQMWINGQLKYDGSGDRTLTLIK